MGKCNFVYFPFSNPSPSTTNSSLQETADVEISSHSTICTLCQKFNIRFSTWGNQLWHLSEYGVHPELTLAIAL